MLSLCGFVPYSPLALLSSLRRQRREMLSRSADPRALLMDTPLQIPLVTPNVESHAVPGPIEKAAKVLFAFFISMVFMDVGWHLFSKESSGLLDLEPLACRVASLLLNLLFWAMGWSSVAVGRFAWTCFRSQIRHRFPSFVRRNSAYRNAPHPDVIVLLLMVVFMAGNRFFRTYIVVPYTNSYCDPRSNRMGGLVPPFKAFPGLN